jgi:hypothetical protein
MALPGTLPGVQFGAKGVDRSLAGVPMAMDGQPLGLLPALGGANLAPQVRSDLFPGIQTVPCRRRLRHND